MRYVNTQLKVSLPEDSNLTDLVLKTAHHSPEAPAYALSNGIGGWIDVSYREFLDRVRAVAKGLIARGIKPGDLVAVLAPTSYQWAVIDQALWFAGAISVPIYDTSSPAQISHILSDSGTTVILHQGTLQAQAAEKAVDELNQSATDSTRIERLALDEDLFDALTTDGETISDEQLEQARSAATLSDPATIVYTSGTTGSPKGTIITHGNLALGAANLLEYTSEILAAPENRTLMFLPLAHILARAVQFGCLVGKIQIAHTPNLGYLLRDIGSFRPTWLLLVPRMLEKIEAGIINKAREGGQEKIVRAARQVAIEYSTACDAQQRGEGSGPSMALKLKHKVFDKLVFSKIRALMGGNARVAISGASPLHPELAHFFSGMGIHVKEGYGLTESTAPATVNVPGVTRIGSVGRPMHGMEVQLADDDEILLRGIAVTPGYYGAQASGESAVDEHGWFHTGDIGRLDDQGYLYVTGRKKELLVTAGGKNVAPTPLEEAIRTCELVDQAVVVGNNRPFVGALIALDTDALKHWCEQHDRHPLSLTEAATDEQVREEIQQYIDQANESVSRAESVRKFKIISAELTQEAGYVTPAAKLQRNRVIEDFQDQIESLYSSGSARNL
ncbi:AMP-dependent synthetase/ligase [Auritidibacter ignavus]|uniref:AMP-dependent synthetase/ligase n=1 Tax=Auritidibacter ignavus TaxID=678932 RepID=UPI00244CF0B3|nr:AMP-dependent synthetase/ligase [Auritidibacter ignavus]WGH84883.1 AMP-dependent synthetase/ligase [Auritidibacter ignavus]